MCVVIKKSAAAYGTCDLHETDWVLNVSQARLEIFSRTCYSNNDDDVDG